MSKKYEINTLDDMINCVTEENLDNFITDLKAFLKMYIGLNDIAKTLIELEGIKSDGNPLKSKGFTWIDDGKHEYKIDFVKDE